MMTHDIRSLSLVLMTVLVSGLAAGCSLLSTIPTVPEEPEIPPDPRVLVFADDFSDAPIGEYPPGWSISSNASGHLQVVEDPTAVGGKAVQITGNKERATSMAVTLPTEALIVVVEHAFRVVKVNGLNYWLGYAEGTSFGPHNLNWYPTADGELRYSIKRNGSNVRLDAGALVPGWNHVRIVADLERQEAFLYLNGELQLEQVPFWNVVDKWDHIRLTFYDTGRWADDHPIGAAESYYDDVKIWVVPAEGAANFRQHIHTYLD